MRKAVGSNVIQLRQNRVSLNPGYCWLDIWALKRRFSEIEKSLLNGKHSLKKLTNHALSLYQGPFLGADENDRWVLSAREKLSNQFLNMLDSVAESFTQAKEYKQALACYQKALEIDDLSENIYQGLMHCYMHAGNRAEGVVVYERCRKQLDNVLGVEPSARTKKLYQTLKSS